MPPEQLIKVFAWIQDTSAEDKFVAAYGEGHHSYYVNEKVQLIKRSLTLWWRALDTTRRQNVIDAIMKHRP